MKKNKRIFIVATDPQTFELILKPKLPVLRGRYDVFIVSSKRRIIKEIAVKEGVSGLWLPMKRGISPLFDVFSIFIALFYFYRYRPFVVHSFTPKAGLVSMIGSRLAFISNRVHTFTGLVFPAYNGIKRKVLIFCDYLVFIFSTKIIAESLGVKKQLKSVGIDSDKIEMIGYGNVVGVDVDFFSPDFCPTHDENDLYKICKDSRFVFCFVGRINKDKGLTELVSAFYRMPSDSLLIIVGGIDCSNPLDSKVLDRIDNNSRIVTVGFQGDVRDFIRLCDFFVLPSYREGFPNVLLQACAMGKPAIVTDVPGCNEVVANGGNGWVVKVRDSEALYKAMLSAYSLTEDRLKEMGDASRNIVLLRHERKAHMAKVVSFYEDLFRSPE